MTQKQMHLALQIWEEQAAKRARADFTETEVDEVQAMRLVGVKYFGPASRTRRRMPDGEYGYGALLEVTPDRPGVIFLGYYVDPPFAPNGVPIPPQRRRRQLCFQGVKVSEIEEQAKRIFG